MELPLEVWKIILEFTNCRNNIQEFVNLRLVCSSFLLLTNDVGGPIAKDYVKLGSLQTLTTLAHIERACGYYKLDRKITNLQLMDQIIGDCLIEGEQLETAYIFPTHRRTFIEAPALLTLLLKKIKFLQLGYDCVIPEPCKVEKIQIHAASLDLKFLLTESMKKSLRSLHNYTIKKLPSGFYPKLEKVSVLILDDLDNFPELKMATNCVIGKGKELFLFRHKNIIRIGKHIDACGGWNETEMLFLWRVDVRKLNLWNKVNDIYHLYCDEGLAMKELEKAKDVLLNLLPANVTLSAFDADIRLVSLLVVAQPQLSILC